MFRQTTSAFACECFLKRDNVLFISVEAMSAIQADMETLGNPFTFYTNNNNFILELIKKMIFFKNDSPMVRDTCVQSQVEVIPKTQKMVLDDSLLNTQHYKVRIKGKVEQSREGVAPSPTPWCSSYRKGSLRVTLDYGRQLLLIEFYFFYTSTRGKFRRCLEQKSKNYINCGTN